MSILHFKFVPHIVFFKTQIEYVTVRRYIKDINEETTNDEIFQSSTNNVQYYVMDTRQEFSNEQVDDKSYPTGNDQIDQAILQGLLNDRINFKETMDLVTLHYQFNPQDNLIHIWGSDRNNDPIIPEKLSMVLYSLDPNNDGCIPIVDSNVAELFGYSKIGVHPYVSYVGVLSPQQTPGQYIEYEVDRDKLHINLSFC